MLIADETIKVLKDLGPDKFVALVTDNAANMVKMRALVLNDADCAHLMPLRQAASVFFMHRACGVLQLSIHALTYMQSAGA